MANTAVWQLAGKIEAAASGRTFLPSRPRVLAIQWNGSGKNVSSVNGNKNEIDATPFMVQSSHHSGATRVPDTSDLPLPSDSTVLRRRRIDNRGTRYPIRGQSPNLQLS